MRFPTLAPRHRATSPAGATGPGSTHPSPLPGSPEPAVRPSRRPHRADVAAVATLSAAAALVVALHVVAYPKVSPIDELPHIDSLVRTSDFELVRVGDRVEEAAMREEACRGLDRGDVLPPCDAEDLRPDFFQDLGENTAARSFPVYHLVTGLAARALQDLAGLGSLVTAARLLGAAWLGAALVVSWLVCAELGVPRRARAPALALMLTTPLVLHASAVVNTDATLLLGGAAVFWTVLRWERGAQHWGVPLAVAAVAAVFDEGALLAAAAAGGYLMLRALGRVEGRRAALLLGLGLVATAAAGPVALKQAHTTLIGHTDREIHAAPPEALAVQHVAAEVREGSVPAEEIVSEIDSLVTPVRRPYTPEFLDGAATRAVVRVTDWMLLGAAVGSLFMARRGGRSEALAVALLLVMVAAGPLHAWWNARRDVFFVIPARTGIALVPGLFALLALRLRKPWVLVLVSVLAATAGANTLWKLAGAA